MRYGFTTGSCAAASKAAYMLLTGKIKTKITIETPKGIPYTAEELRRLSECLAASGIAHTLC
ncbi:MAG: cobalt-precorrin-5B (C(1))-methyltransferase, partial [Blautia sp.]|nr:cobalt-precorrin-5B (C(1))-methyltransferase [Blautia sp.]